MKWIFEFTIPYQILEFINTYIYIYLNKNWKIDWSEQFYWSWNGGLVVTVMTVKGVWIVVFTTATCVDIQIYIHLKEMWNFYYLSNFIIKILTTAMDRWSIYYSIPHYCGTRTIFKIILLKSWKYIKLWSHGNCYRTRREYNS